MVRIPDFHCHSLSSVPGWGTEMLQAVCHSQKQTNKQKIDREMNEQCSKEGHKNMAKKQIKRHLILPIIRKIKTTEVLLHTH